MNKDQLSLPKIPLRPKNLKQVVPACGLAALLLRILLYATGVDDKGLLKSGHFTWIALCVLSVAVAAVVLLGTRPIQGPASHRGSFPRSLYACLGCAAAALSSLFTALADCRNGYILYGLAGFLAAAAFALAAYLRIMGKKTMFGLHVVICIHFALQMLKIYQTWSFDPQIQDYFFQILACIALTLTAYQLACFDAGRGSHRALWTCGLAAVYLCCVCVGTGSAAFFLAGGLWAFTNLSSLRRPRRKQQAEPAAE